MSKLYTEEPLPTLSKEALKKPRLTSNSRISKTNLTKVWPNLWKKLLKLRKSKDNLTKRPWKECLAEDYTMTKLMSKNQKNHNPLYQKMSLQKSTAAQATQGCLWTFLLVTTSHKESRWSSSPILSQRLLRTSEPCVPVKKAWAPWEKHCIIKEVFLTVWLKDSWFKWEISPILMVQVVRVSTEPNLTMKTSQPSILLLVISRWPTLVQAPMDLNFSLHLQQPHGLMESMLCSVRSLKKAWLTYLNLSRSQSMKAYQWIPSLLSTVASFQERKLLKRKHMRSRLVKMRESNKRRTRKKKKIDLYHEH